MKTITLIDYCFKFERASFRSSGGTVTRSYKGGLFTGNLECTTELDRLGSSLRSQSENDGSTQTTFLNELYEKSRMNISIFDMRCQVSPSSYS